MRLLLLLTQDLESPSGLGRYWPMAQALAARGHTVRIVALHSDWKGKNPKKITRAGVVIDYVAPMHVSKIGTEKSYYSPVKLIQITLQATLALSRAALSTKVDIIHIGKPHPMNSIAGLLASRLKQTVLCMDCDDYEAGSNRFGKPWQKSVVSYFENNIPPKARLVTTNTHFMQSNLIKWGCKPERIVYLPNGIDRERFGIIDQIKAESIRSRLNLIGKRVILYAGSLSLVNHPVDKLLEAFGKVTQVESDVALVIVGGGEDYTYLLNLARKLGIDQNTHFTGRIDPDEIPYYYEIADVTVDPVKDDDAARGRSPLKLFESWACGVPFLTSPVGDRKYLLGQPPAGLLTEPAGDPEAMAEGLLQILCSKVLADELRLRGHGRIQQYTWDSLAAQLEMEYQKII